MIRCCSWLLAAFACFALLLSALAAEGGEHAFLGLWVQEDSGGVMHFLPEGKIIGWPVGGTYKFGDKDWIEIASGSEKLECRWRQKSDNTIELRRFVEGKEDLTHLQRLKAVSLDFEAWKGKYFIWHLVALSKRATGRAVLLDKQGYFRTKEGGFYLRLLEAKNGGILAYASGEEDETINVQVFKGGDYVVLFDRLEKPRLFASCMKAPAD
ncbi:MAG: hypothetical protein ACR2OZ_08925 [Verrucomicrobiales bacterium]